MDRVYSGSDFNDIKHFKGGTMLIKLITIFACGLSAMALYIMMALLTVMARENELPDLEDIEV